jgi:drug/metabolite transporter (DMT)-like permease
VRLPILNENQRAVLFLVLAGCGFGLSDTLTKLTAFSLPISEVVFVRGVATSLCLFVALALTGDLPAVCKTAKLVIMGRGFLEMMGTITFIGALSHVKLAELSTLAMSSPIFLILFAIIFYKEPVGWHRWATIIAGVLGVICVSKPNPAEFNAWALLGVLCAIASAARDIVTRRIDPDIPSLAVVLPGSILITLFGWTFGYGVEWPIPRLDQIAFLFVAGIGHGLGIYLTVLSFRGNITLSLVSPFRYISIVWTGLGGLLVFGEIPDAWAVTGAILIVGAGLYALHREIIWNRPLSAIASSEN